MYKGTSESEKEYSIEVSDGEVRVDQQPIGSSFHKIKKGKYRIIHKNKVYQVEIIGEDSQGKEAVIKVNGTKYHTQLKDSLDQVLEKMGITQNSEGTIQDLKAPMPGMILEIPITEGSQLKKGDQVIILEAMKMENILKAPGDVTVKKILVNQGDSVEKKQVLVEFE